MKKMLEIFCVGNKIPTATKLRVEFYLFGNKEWLSEDRIKALKSNLEKSLSEAIQYGSLINAPVAELKENEFSDREISLIKDKRLNLNLAVIEYLTYLVKIFTIESLLLKSLDYRPYDLHGTISTVEIPMFIRKNINHFKDNWKELENLGLVQQFDIYESIEESVNTFKVRSVSELYSKLNRI